MRKSGTILPLCSLYPSLHTLFVIVCAGNFVVWSVSAESFASQWSFRSTHLKLRMRMASEGGSHKLSGKDVTRAALRQVSTELSALGESANRKSGF